MGRYVREAQVASGKTWTAAAVEEDTLRTTACRQGCRVRYVFLLDEAARGRAQPQFRVRAGWRARGRALGLARPSRGARARAATGCA